MRRPLSLTDAQLTLVQQAAKLLPIGQRDDFLRALASRLGERPSTVAVTEAINASLDLQVLDWQAP